jgi:hypothetical protein
MNANIKPTDVLYPLSSLILIVVFGLMVSLACGAFSSKPDEPTATAKTVPTAAVAAPTAPPPTAPPPTEALSPAEPTATQEQPGAGGGVINPNASKSGDIYYSETFDNVDNWRVFLMKGPEEGFEQAVFDNRLRVQLATQDTWAYYQFEGGEFTDVRIDVEVENRASNTNFVGMICRYTENGWYEVNVLNTGEYIVYYSNGDAGGGQLFKMHKGATYNIRTGRKINDYVVVCEGEELTLAINGYKEFALPLKTGDYPFLKEGKVGLSVATSYAIPVVVDFLQFILSVP